MTFRSGDGVGRPGHAPADPAASSDSDENDAGRGRTEQRRKRLKKKKMKALFNADGTFFDEGDDDDDDDDDDEDDEEGDAAWPGPRPGRYDSPLPAPAPRPRYRSAIFGGQMGMKLDRRPAQQQQQQQQQQPRPRSRSEQRPTINLVLPRQHLQQQQQLGPDRTSSKKKESVSSSVSKDPRPLPISSSTAAQKPKHEERGKEGEKRSKSKAHEQLKEGKVGKVGKVGQNVAGKVAKHAEGKPVEPFTRETSSEDDAPRQESKRSAANSGLAENVHVHDAESKKQNKNQGNVGQNYGAKKCITKAPPPHPYSQADKPESHLPSGNFNIQSKGDSRDEAEREKHRPEKADRNQSGKAFKFFKTKQVVTKEVDSRSVQTDTDRAEDLINVQRVVTDKRGKKEGKKRSTASGPASSLKRTGPSSNRPMTADSGRGTANGNAARSTGRTLRKRRSSVTYAEPMTDDEDDRGKVGAGTDGNGWNTPEVLVSDAEPWSRDAILLKVGPVTKTYGWKKQADQKGANGAARREAGEENRGEAARVKPAASRCKSPKQIEEVTRQKRREGVKEAGDVIDVPPAQRRHVSSEHASRSLSNKPKEAAMSTTPVAVATGDASASDGGEVVQKEESLPEVLRDASVVSGAGDCASFVATPPPKMSSPLKSPPLKRQTEATSLDLAGDIGCTVWPETPRTRRHRTPSPYRKRRRRSSPPVRWSTPPKKSATSAQPQPLNEPAAQKSAPEGASEVPCHPERALPALPGLESFNPDGGCVCAALRQHLRVLVQNEMREYCLKMAEMFRDGPEENK